MDSSVSTQSNEITRQKNILDINHTRTCHCGPTHINCITPKEWIKCQLGVWEFKYEERDVRDKTIHPATYPIELATKIISLFSHKGELVVDPFVGSGTTLIAARDLERNAVGFDLSKKYVDFCNTRLSQQRLSTKSKQLAIDDDALNISNYFKEETIKCMVTSPPYANLLNRKRKNKSRRGSKRYNDQYLKVEQYSQDTRDLGTMDIHNFSEAIYQIYKNALPYLKPKGHSVINVADMWMDNKRIPIHIYVTNAMERAGYELRNTIIWNRLNIVNNLGIFGWPSNYITMGTTFEYILDFWKPDKK